MNKKDRTLIINHQIRAEKVLCIGEKGENLGIITLSEALNKARQLNLDLLQISPAGKDKPPTCKILDYGKYKFDLSKKQKENEKKQRESIVKDREIVFRPVTDLNDLKVKAKKVEEFLLEGARVKISISFKNKKAKISSSKASYKEVALNTLEQFLNLLPMAQTTSLPSMEGKDLVIFLQRKEEIK